MVRNWAEANGYSFNYAGDMGSMGHSTGRHSHSPDEPVTNISLQDTYTWCNAISEIFGLKPAYYADPQKKEVYRSALKFRLEMYQGDGYPFWPFKKNHPKGSAVDTGSWTPVFMDAGASGFRIPTPREFASMTAKFKPDEVADYQWLKQNSDDKTHAAGTRKPDANGLFDIEGNVVEWAWGSLGGTIEGAPYRHGGYFYRGYGERSRAFDMCEFAGLGRPFCGFRIMRRAE
jgi:hypothetical protein